MIMLKDIPDITVYYTVYYCIIVYYTVYYYIEHIWQLNPQLKHNYDFLDINSCNYETKN